MANLASELLAADPPARKAAASQIQNAKNRKANSERIESFDQGSSREREGGKRGVENEYGAQHAKEHRSARATHEKNRVAYG